MSDLINIQGVGIKAIAAAVPKNTIENSLAGLSLFGEKTPKVIKATGIEQRRILKNGSGVDLACCALKKLHEADAFNGEDIGGVVFLTTTPDNLMPNNSSKVQGVCGLPSEIPYFDINHACAGFPYALWVASLMAKNLGKDVLLLNADKQSHITSREDKSTALIFSDGAAAVLVGASENAQSVFSFETQSSLRESIIVKDGGGVKPYSDDSLLYRELEDGSKIRDIDIHMSGIDIFNFVVKDVLKHARKFQERSKIEVDIIDKFVFHQANKFMIRQLSRNLGIPWDKVPITLDRFGNSSSSTVPIALSSAYEENIKDQRVFLCGFGAGASIGSCIVEIIDAINLGVEEYDI